MGELDRTVDLSEYDPIKEGEIQVEGSDGSGLFGSSDRDINEYKLTAEIQGENYEEERTHKIRSGHGTLDEFRILRESDSSEADPRVFEEMHPSVVLGSRYDPSKINLELRDPTTLISQEDRIEQDREIYLRTREGTGPKGTLDDGMNELPYVEGFIREDQDGAVFELSAIPEGHYVAVAQIEGKTLEGHLTDVLKTIGLPSWETISYESDENTQ